MSIAQYQLCWNSYKNNVCNGFTKLQQNEEFVDMTLAADGHLVKVHKNIFALASPYIKSMLQSSPSGHPIIFLGSVSHEVLNYILTYVYTGEVSVEADKIQSFMRVAKDLRLSGLFNIATPEVGSKENKENVCNNQEYEENGIPDSENYIEEQVSDNVIQDETDIDNTMPEESISSTKQTMMSIKILDSSAIPIDRIGHISNVENVSSQHLLSDSVAVYNEPEVKANEEILNNSDRGLYMTADGYQYKLEVKGLQNNNSESTCIRVEDTSITNIGTTSADYHNDDFGSYEKEYKKHMSIAPSSLGPLDPKDLTPQYTISSRGSFQLILNRYMYYCHHQSHGGRKRRWRCIDYRSNHCPAFIDTDREIMTSRKFQHIHGFHDEKIRKKMKRDLVVTNLNILVEIQNEKDKVKKNDNNKVDS